MLYFAYGSNMSLRRLRARVPSAQRFKVATLHAHRLAFHKIGTDGSAKCDISPCTHGQATVFGVLYTMAARHRAALDRAEGLGNGYEVKQLDVVALDGERVSAFSYYATAVDDALQPFDWYLRHVLHGARENALPADYTARIAAIATVRDPDPERARRELAIHTSADDVRGTLP